MSTKSKSLGWRRLLPALALAILGAVTTSEATTVNATFYTTADTTIIPGGYATTPFGTGNTLGVGSFFGGARQSSVVDFNVSSLAGQYSAINSITLLLQVDAVDATGPTPPLRTTQVFALTSANAGWTESGATWNTQDGTTPWIGGAGAESGYDAPLLASNTIDLAALPLPSPYISFYFTGSSAALTALMNNWVTVMPGLLLREGQPLGSDLNRVVYWSRNFGSAYGPVLYVNYTMVPEPSTMLLLVVGGLLVWHRRRMTA